MFNDNENSSSDSLEKDEHNFSQEIMFKSVKKKMFREKLHASKIKITVNLCLYKNKCFKIIFSKRVDNKFMIINFNIPIHNFLFITFPIIERCEIEIEWEISSILTKTWPIESSSKIEDIKKLFSNYCNFNNPGTESFVGKMCLEIYNQIEILYQFKNNFLKQEFSFSFGYDDSYKKEIENLINRIYHEIEEILS